jgi:hypothetical protein
MMKHERGAVEIVRGTDLSRCKHALYFRSSLLISVNESVGINLLRAPADSISLIFIQHGRQPGIVAHRGGGVVRERGPVRGN